MPNIPANAKKPTDRLTAKDEAQGTLVEIEYNEESYLIDPKAMNDIEVLEFIEDAQYIKATKKLIGNAQWVKYKDSNRDEEGRVNPDGFQDFLSQVMKAMGN